MKPAHRRSLLVAAGAAAAGLGGWISWRRSAPTAESTRQSADALWATPLVDPQGQPLPTAPLRGKPLLVNFWATWCPPCIKELPEINQFHAESQGRGWQVLGIAVDSAEAVQAFLKKTPLGFPVAVTGTAGLSLVRALGNPAGGLPFSVVINEQGNIRWLRLGTTRLDELRALAAS